MLDAMFSHLRSVADTWQEEAGRRRRFTTVDPVADVLEHCATELRGQLETLASDTYYLPVHDYARLHDVTAATVRAWIKRGELQVVDTDGGMRIRRDERRRKRA